MSVVASIMGMAAGEKPIVFRAIDVDLWSYDGLNYDQNSENDPYGLFISPDGLYAYNVGITSDIVFRFELSTAWDISTATYGGNSFSVAGQDTTPRDVHFKPDGTVMYMLGDAGDDVNQYALSTPWDVTTATYQKVFTSTLGSANRGFTFHPDGTSVYIIDTTARYIYRYYFSTGWDVGTFTATYDSLFINEDASPINVTFYPDGTKMIITGYGNHKFYQYSLSTPWDITTATYDSKSFLYTGFAGLIGGIQFSANGTAFYCQDASNPDAIYQLTSG